VYDGASLPGMSGGPVFDQNIRLIAIHGNAKTTLSANGAVIAISNYGIPINTLIELAKKVGINLQQVVVKPTPLVKPTPPVNPTPTTSNDVPEIYGRLSNLLAAGNWRDADEETKRLILKAAGRDDNEFLTNDSIKIIPCQTLKAINQLWVTYSSGRFGFITQKSIWVNLGGKLGEANEGVYGRFADQVKWRSRGSWLSNNQLNFSLEAPKGHLPKSFLDGAIWGQFLGQVDICKL
jgi:hypothetical protein